jgi:hypothetical protein
MHAMTDIFAWPTDRFEIGDGQPDATQHRYREAALSGA